MEKKRNRKNVGRFSGSNVRANGMSRRHFLGTTAAGLGAAALGATGLGGMAKAIGARSPRAAVYNSEYVFQILAVKPLGQSTFEEKDAAISYAIGLLKAKVYSLNDVSIVQSEPPLDGLDYGYMYPGDEFYYGRGGFVWRDYNLDNQIDWENERESGRGITVSFITDNTLLQAAGPEFALMLPWTISVFSGLYPPPDPTDPETPVNYESDCLYVVAQVPQTFVRLFMRSADNYDAWLGVANMCQQKIRDLVRDTFSEPGSGWITDVNQGIIKMDEATIEQIEDVYGTLDASSIGHKVPIGPSDSYDVGSVVDAIVESIIAGDALFQTNENPPGMYDDLVNEMFLKYVQGSMSWLDFYTQFYGAAIKAWLGSEEYPMPRTILKFTGVRVLDFSSKFNKSLKIIEMCQPFYGHTGLSMGFHHAPSLPDTIVVWEENGGIWVKALNVHFLIEYFFYDVTTLLGCLEPLQPSGEQNLICNVLWAFPAILENEVSTMLNRALGAYLFPLTPLPHPSEL